MQLFVILAVLAVLLVVWFAVSLTALIFHFIPWIIIGLIAGAIASAITGSRHGLLGDIGLGLIGSVLGGVLMRVVFHYNSSGFISDVLVAIVGAVILLLIGKAISPRRARYY
jgi:uncharacterized membrane protein YeaQ/YmgE (transglycosylase-associated protein family)